MEYRFHLSRVEVEGKDGRIFSVPWSKVPAPNGEVSLSRAFAQEHPDAPRSVCLDSGAAKVARRLRERALWNAGGLRLKCPSVARTLILPGVIVAAIVTVFGLFLGSVVVPVWQSPGFDWNALQQGLRAALILAGILFAMLFAAMAAVPVLAVWPYVRFRWRHPDLTGLYATPDALVYERLDGSETRLPWARLARFDSRGRIDFEDSLESPLQICIACNADWVVLRDRLRRTHPQAFVSPLAPSEFARFLVPLTIAAVIGEVILAIVVRLLGIDAVPPGKLLWAAGVMAAFGSSLKLLTAYEQTIRRRSRKRRRVFRAPTKSDQ